MEKTIYFKTILDVKKFVTIVSKCNYNVNLISSKYVIDAKSIMSIFSLDLSKPIKLVLDSEDCDDILEQLQSFIYE